MSQEELKNPGTKKKKIINLYDMYEEKREYPRIKVNTLAVIEKTGDYEVNAILHDISPDGVQLRCNRKSAHTIHPTGKFISGKTAPEVALKFTLPIDGKDKDVIVQAKIYYFSIIEIDVVAFGAKFIQFEKFTERHVDDFIMKSVVPVEEKVLNVLDSPRTSEDILNELDLDDENIDLNATLNRLRKKKAVVSYEDDKTRKFIKLEAAIATIFERLEKIEKKLNKTD
ncbi:MAG: PilZ domain-containing protein [Proteobacteria bacterium]|nr:PilZ domain-containing protein [Pseudomonadota bacterium]NOG59404.1 PilZ domain-containing protein [Pseudomonadota bacterium]